MATRKSKSKPNQLPTQVVGNIGLFYTCYELSRRGLNVVPTSRNTRGVDLIVGSEDFSQQSSVQIKTSKIKMATFVGEKEKFPGRLDIRYKFQVADFWVFVLLHENGYSVNQTAVCNSSDYKLLEETPKHWLLSPWKHSKNADPKTVKKWSQQKNENGWDLIVRELTPL
ncbi:MAG: hypothetical protein OXU98_09260 [Gammaproteobacteria bacterium]|nr:hypothetical protein [Gammaproteobacteria bacterium]